MYTSDNSGERVVKYRRGRGRKILKNAFFVNSVIVFLLIDRLMIYLENIY